MFGTTFGHFLVGLLCLFFAFIFILSPQFSIDILIRLKLLTSSEDLFSSVTDSDLSKDDWRERFSLPICHRVRGLKHKERSNKLKKEETAIVRVWRLGCVFI